MTKSLLYSFALLTAWAAPVNAEKTNFVVIFTDDQGYEDVGCFGSPDIRTPRLDAMAADGMKFTNFYAQPVCGPSSTSLQQFEVEELIRQGTGATAFLPLDRVDR